jgi:hypothetical protein
MPVSVENGPQTFRPKVVQNNAPTPAYAHKAIETNTAPTTTIISPQNLLNNALKTRRDPAADANSIVATMDANSTAAIQDITMKVRTQSDQIIERKVTTSLKLTFRVWLRENLKDRTANNR